MYLCPSGEQMLDAFMHKLKSITNLHLKLKTRYVKSKCLPPWMDQEVQINIAKRDKLKKHQMWTEHKHRRNFTTNEKEKNLTDRLSDPMVYS